MQQLVCFFKKNQFDGIYSVYEYADEDVKSWAMVMCNNALIVFTFLAKQCLVSDLKYSTGELFKPVPLQW